MVQLKFFFNINATALTTNEKDVAACGFAVWKYIKTCTESANHLFEYRNGAK